MPAGVDGAFGGDVDRSFLFLDHVLDLAHGLEVCGELVFGDSTDLSEPEGEFLECKEVIGHQEGDAGRADCCCDEFVVMVGSVVAEDQGGAFDALAGLDHVELAFAHKSRIDACRRVIEDGIRAPLDYRLLLPFGFFWDIFTRHS